MNRPDAKPHLEDARPIPHRPPYERDEVKPDDGCGCRRHNIRLGCVRHDPQERKAA